MQSDNAITKARAITKVSSGAVGVGVSAVDVAKITVGAGASVGEEVAEFGEGTKVGDKFGEVKFTNALNESFGFPLLLKRPKLESDLTV